MILPVLSTPNEKTSSGEDSLFQALKMLIIPLVDDIAVALLVIDEIVARCLCTKVIKSVSSHFLIKQKTSIIMSLFRLFKICMDCSSDDTPVTSDLVFT